ncbi:MAG TPA: HNH endonuclease [Rudaea sp.]|nr:HNH endonuclease [Rudaea sp.]
MNVRLHEACVYTIATPEHLLEASQSETLLHESKRWVTAATLLADAQGHVRELPIVFADSRDCSILIGWSVVRSINVTVRGTHYAIGPLWHVPRSTPQDLQLLSSEEYIAEGHIRPYVLCKTPAFLLRQAKKPRAWSLTASVKKEAREGERRLAAHTRLERSSALVAALKKDRMARHNGRLPCEVCGFDFLENYGPIGAGFAEAHHKISLAESPEGGRIASLADLAVVCSNCHRMLHRHPEYPNIESLRNRVRHARKKAQPTVPADGSTSPARR